MIGETKTIDSALAKSLSEKSEDELLAMLGSPSDWRTEVLDFARSELGRRSVSTVEIDQALSEKAKEHAETLGKRAEVPMTFWESAFSVIYGAGLGMLGLLAIWPQASRFKSQGYLLKAQKSWTLYWLGFGSRIVLVLILILWAIMTKSK
jgi:hypothetical protein